MFISVNRSSFIIFLYCLILGILVGGRDVSVGTDTINYDAYFKLTSDCKCLLPPFEPGFQILTFLVSLITDRREIYFFILSMITFSLVSLISLKAASQLSSDSGTKRLFRSLIFVFFLVSPFFVSAQINLLRSGIAGILMIYGFLAYSDKQWIRFIVASTIAVSLHYSALLYLPVIVILHFRLRTLFIWFSILSLFYASGFTQIATDFLATQAGVDFLRYALTYGADSDYRSGVRYDFLFFSWVPLFVARLFLIRHNSVDSVPMKNYVKIYILLLFPFLFFGYAAFSDRYAFPAWLFSSILFAASARRFKTLRTHRRIMIPVAFLVGSLIFVSMVFSGERLV